MLDCCIVSIWQKDCIHFTLGLDKKNVLFNRCLLMIDDNE